MPRIGPSSRSRAATLPRGRALRLARGAPGKLRAWRSRSWGTSSSTCTTSSGRPRSTATCWAGSSSRPRTSPLGRMPVALFSSGRTHHELLLIEVGEDAQDAAPRAAMSGLYHFGLKVGDSDDELRAAHPALSRKPVSRIVGMSDHTVTHSLYITDPDGNEIELYIDVPGVSWDLENVMAPVKGACSVRNFAMPAVTVADITALPHIPQPDPAASTFRPVHQRHHRASRTRGRGLPGAPRVCGDRSVAHRPVHPHGSDGRGGVRAWRAQGHAVASASRLRDGHVHDRRDVPAPGFQRRRWPHHQRRYAVDDRRARASCTSSVRPRS